MTVFSFNWYLKKIMLMGAKNRKLLCNLIKIN